MAKYVSSEIMNNLNGCIIRNRYDSIGKYGQVIRVERKKGFNDLYEVEYKYLEERIKCTCQFDAAVYNGEIFEMFLIGGKGGHWVTSDKVEIVKNLKPMQMSLF
jgi:hypothetical protein